MSCCGTDLGCGCELVLGKTSLFVLVDGPGRRVWLLLLVPYVFLVSPALGLSRVVGALMLIHSVIAFCMYLFASSRVSLKIMIRSFNISRSSEMNFS